VIPSPYIVLKIYHPVFILSVYRSFPPISLHTSVPAAETAGCINYKTLGDDINRLIKEIKGPLNLGASTIVAKYLLKLYTPQSLLRGNLKPPFEKGVWGIIMQLQWNWERGPMLSIKSDTIL
jgi:hypothetical protein